MRLENDHANNRMSVPILLPTGRDAELVGSILGQEQIDVVACDSMHDILNQLRMGCGPFIIGDEALFDFLEHNPEAVCGFDRAAVHRMVADSVTLKAAVVARDEQEAGERRILNFGHTLGHALEKVCGVAHGEAVSAGMVFAARLSAARQLIDSETAARVENLIRRLGLPRRIDADPVQLLDALRRDKKREGSHLFFVLIEKIGKAVVATLTLEEVAEELNAYYRHDAASR